MEHSDGGAAAWLPHAQVRTRLHRERAQAATAAPQQRRGGGARQINERVARGTFITKRLLAALRRNDPSTRALSFERHDLRARDLVALAEVLQRNTSAQSLNMSLNGLTALEARLLNAVLTHNKALCALRLGSNRKLAGEGIEWIAAALRSNTSLQQLDLQDCKIGAQDLDAIVQALQANADSALHCLGLRLNRFGFGDGLARLVALDRLAVVDLRACNVGDAGVAVLCDAISGAASLTALDVPFNNFSDEGATKLAEILDSSGSALIALNLDYNDIGDRGADALASALAANRTLTSLNMANNAVSSTAKAQLHRVWRASVTLYTLELAW